MKMAYLAKCDKYNIATNILLRGGGIDQAWLDHKGRLMGTCLKPTPIGQFMVMLMIDDNHKNDDNEDKTRSLAHV